MGKITVSEQIVSKIILKSVNETSGILCESTNGMITNITNWIGGSSTQKGVEIKNSDKGLDIHVRVTIQYCLMMLEVGRQLQSNIREAVENFTGLVIARVNVTIVGLSFN
ncbi:Asp23/Gls24 family envelope stress response protein [Paenibacillus sp. JNUCC31]|uniref:Asp23/Gls24 family envelope stress response protein n=1 Tax=Paenibacillus sp. JNUCC-31 TaxID=2777983 RepID=UPI001E326241|nr:Asp23/Gls24 family envelope stress response protein [Paenibacillus sp. JNUCC-31]